MLLCTFLAVLASCTSKNSRVDTGSYSQEFEKIRRQTDTIWAHGKVDEGLYYLDSAFSKLNHPFTNDRFRYYCFHYVYYQKIKINYNKSLLYADSALAVAKQSVNSKQYSMNLAEASFSRGDALFDLKLYTDAYQSYYQGYLIGKNYLNIAALADYTYRMGMIMYKQHHYKLAIKYFKDSYHQTVKDNLKVERNFVGFYRRQELLDNIGLSYKHDNQNDSAIVYFNKALKEIDSNEPLYKDRKQHMYMARGVVYGNKADVYILQGLNSKAVALLKRSIVINLKKGYDNRDAELSEIKLGDIYLKQNQSGLLIDLLGDLGRQLDTVDNADARADYNRLLSTYYLKKGDLKNAIAHIQLYNTIKDSIIKKERLLLETDVNQQLANYEKQHEIDQLNNDNKLQVIYLSVSILCAIMALIVIFLVVRNWRRSKKDVQTVSLLNKQINQQNQILESALNELKNNSQEKDRILRTVAHDLRNPIGGIASLTAMMVEEDYTEDQKELINLVKDTSVNSLELINEILEATNVSSISLNLEPVEINSLVNNSVELLRFKAAEKGQQILLEPLKKQQDLYISREKIWRVISNLITNAIKFSPTGAIITVKLIAHDYDITISVGDNGIGIPENLRNEVFHMFTSAQRPGTAGEKSFGLGLSICSQIIEKHKGRIWFEANKPNGTIFYVSLPWSDKNVQTVLPQKISVPLA